MAEKVKQYRHPDDPITLDELKKFPLGGCHSFAWSD